MVRMRGNVARWGHKGEDGNSQTRSFHVLMNSKQRGYTRQKKNLV